MKECKFCGKEFEPNPDKHNHNQIYCSKKCNKKAYYYSEKGRATSLRSLKKIMKRYHTDIEFNKYWKEKNHRYAISKKGKATRKKQQRQRRKTENGKLSDLKYRKSYKRKNSLKKYTSSEKGKMNGIRNANRRRGRLKNITHGFTSEEWIQKKRNTFGVCSRCNKWVGINKLSLDHIIPISKAPHGFIYQIEDVQPLCKSCNSSKNNRIED